MMGPGDAARAAIPAVREEGEEAGLEAQGEEAVARYDFAGGLVAGLVGCLVAHWCGWGAGAGMHRTRWRQAEAARSAAPHARPTAAAGTACNAGMAPMQVSPSEWRMAKLSDGDVL